ncbi:carboxypeptidase-like regulatory domain-containing protein, partial [Bacteroidales bacterium OttesenSCG-928-L19]|nr:carboxypeptidase-like regulatory domain-containing protein [Bacteroidales bacterium OttesenSCG-928-L19]
MMKKLLLSLGVILLGISISYAQQSTFKGTVTDNTGMPVAYANIYLKQEGKVLNGGMTDAKGDYQIFGVSPGTYDLEFKGPMGCGNTYTKTGISIGSGAVQFVNFEVSCATDLPPVTVTYQPPVFDPTKTTSGDRMSGDDVRKTPGYSITNAIASMQGVTTQDGSILSVRGNRSTGQTTIIDGVRVRGGSAVSMQS